MIDLKNITLKDLAGYISEQLKNSGIKTILVGGACVSIYSNNIYQTNDIDFISYEGTKKIKDVLEKLGFIQKNKYFRHPDCHWFIEFVSPPVSVGDEPIMSFNHVQTKLGEIILLSAVDTVKDRLVSFFYWKDNQALQQAINICKEQNIDFNELERWVKQEGQMEKYKPIKKRLKDANK